MTHTPRSKTPADAAALVDAMGEVAASQFDLKSRSQFWRDLMARAAERVDPKFYPWKPAEPGWGLAMVNKATELSHDIRILRLALKKSKGVMDAVLDNRKYRPDIHEATAVAGMALKTTGVDE